jgi:hypothetical protein
MDLGEYQFKKLEFLCVNNGYNHDNNKSNFWIKAVKISLIVIFVGMPLACGMAFFIYVCFFRNKKVSPIRSEPLSPEPRVVESIAPEHEL